MLGLRDFGSKTQIIGLGLWTAGLEQPYCFKTLNPTDELVYRASGLRTSGIKIQAGNRILGYSILYHHSKEPGKKTQA